MVFWNRFVPWKLMGKVEQKIYQYHGIDGTLKQIHLASILSKVFLSPMICYVLKYIPFIKRTLENAFIVIKWYSRYCLHSMKCLSVISIYIFKSSTCHTYVHHKHYIHSSIRTYTELKIHKDKLWVISYMYYIKYSYSTMMSYILIQSDWKINYLA